LLPQRLTRIAIVAYPRLSNLDEFQPLRSIPGVRLTWARTAAELEAADWIILPGSKAVAADLAWLREHKLDAVIARHADAGKPLIGICGGLQMLGETLIDPHGIDGNAPGLGLLPLVTQFEKDKLLRPARLRFAAQLAAPWQALQGLKLEGYEIHHGRTVQHPGMAAAPEALHDDSGGVVGWQSGSVLGVYAHGLFEQAPLLRALFGADVRTLDSVFDGLADYIDHHFQPGTLAGLLNP
jgi:adenosylcobyric acid synthase